MSPLALPLVGEKNKLIEPPIAIDVMQLAGGPASDPLPKSVNAAVSVCVECCLLARRVVPGLARLHGHRLPRIRVSAATAKNRCESDKSTAHHQS